MGLQWYARYPGDYLRDTAHLTMLEHGAYTLLMDYYYSTGVPLPAYACANAPTLVGTSNPRLYRICRAVTQEEQEAVDNVISNFFKLHNGHYHHARIDEEIEKREDISNKRREAREARMNKRGEDKPANAPTNADASADTNADTTTTTTTTTLSNNKGPTLKELSIDHIGEWLAEKRTNGKYLTVDEHELLEMFKDFCTSKGKTYKDYVAGFRNAFKWHNVPTKGGTYEKNKHYGARASKTDRAKAAVSRGLASIPDPAMPAHEERPAGES